MEIKSRVCPSCKEMNNPGFSSCWKCHQSLDQAQSISTNDDLNVPVKNIWEMAQEASLKTYMLLEKAKADIADVNSMLCPHCHTKCNPTFKQCWACGLDFATNKLPVQSPRDIARIKSWKVYFWFMTLMVARGLLDIVMKPNARDILGVAFEMLTLVALYGFCFKRKIGLRKYWKVGFVACLLQEMLLSPMEMLSLIKSASYGSEAYFFIITGWLLFSIPLYVAMYRYAFKSNDIWGEEVSSKLTCSQGA